MLLNEIKTVQAYKPTETERVVMSLAIIADTPQLAVMQIDSDDNRYYAMNKLISLNILSRTPDDGVELTASGQELAQAQGLVDNGEPTESAIELAASISPDSQTSD